MGLDTSGSRRWWEGEPGDDVVDRSGPDDGVDDGLEAFVAVATGRRSPRAGFDDDDDVGVGVSGERGLRTSPLRHLGEFASSVPPRRALVLLAGAVGAVVLLVALMGGGGGPTVDPTLPVAGASSPQSGAPGLERAATGESGSGGAEIAGGGSAGDGPGGSAASDGVGGDAAVVHVHVAGAVERPGVHLLPVGARVHDAIAAAGGSRPEADLDRLNLAAPVADGSQVYVAVRGAAAGGASATPGAGGAVEPGSVGGPVSLSSADATALDALPGVGPSTAAAIIAHRDANGPFGSVDELLEVRGIGVAKLEGLRDLVVP